MMPEPIFLASRQLIFRPLHLSTSRDTPSCLTVLKSPLDFHWPSYNPQRCRGLRSSFARTVRRTISGSLNTNRMLTVLPVLWLFIFHRLHQSGTRHSSTKCSVEKSVPSRAVTA